MGSSSIPTAVIGVGYLGKFHAEKHHDLEDADLIAVVDTDSAAGEKVADSLKVPFYTDYRDLLHKVKAVSVVVPTVFHYQIAKDFLEAGVHVLVEKPIASTVAQAQELVDLAKKKNCVLEVGHIQRFNAAMRTAQDLIKNPIFLEIHRMSPFPKRSTDIDVVLDLMIHDLDLALELVGHPIKEIRASGVPVITDNVDIANARIEFENGAVANFTASRVSLVTMRKFRVFEKDHYYSIDFAEGVLEKAIRVKEKGTWRVDMGRQSFGNQDNLKEEIQSFLKRAKNPDSGDSMGTPGEAGLRALEAATQITSQITERLKNFQGILS